MSLFSKGIDPAKVFIFAMCLVIGALAVAILMTFFKVRDYEEQTQLAVRSYFSRLAEGVETSKEYRKRVAEEDKVDLENPITYINEKARMASISTSAFNYTPPKPDLRNRSKGFVDTIIKLTFTEDVTRSELASFLYNLEKGSSILKVYSLDLSRDSRVKKADPKDDRWRPVITLGYRKPYVGGSSRT